MSDNDLLEITQNVNKELFEVQTIGEAVEIEQKYLGRSGQITNLLKGLKDVPADKRSEVGAKLNKVRIEVDAAIKSVVAGLKQRDLEARLVAERIDVTLDKFRAQKLGSIHPITQMQNKILSVLTGLGYSQVDGFEVEEDKYNFELLNIPKAHPARDMQDTFFVSPDLLLRTHTSGVQARVLKDAKLPLKIFSVGRVFRVDELDATHAPAFYQIEGLYVAKNVSMGMLKQTLETILKNLFGENTKLRFRASYFPFTEPSVEVDASCPNCGGSGCASCGNSGWLELLGAGMVHPKVLEMAGIDSGVYSGFAFGLGVDRFAKVGFKIADMRVFYQNDKRFLEQF